MTANPNGPSAARLWVRGHGPRLPLRDPELADRDRLARPVLLQCCSARGFGADRHGNPLTPFDCGGSLLGSDAVSMLSVAYGYQMPANGGPIDSPEAFQRQVFAICRSGYARYPPARCRPKPPSSRLSQTHCCAPNNRRGVRCVRCENHAPKGVPIALPDRSNRREKKAVVQSAFSPSGA